MYFVKVPIWNGDHFGHQNLKTLKHCMRNLHTKISSKSSLRCSRLWKIINFVGKIGMKCTLSLFSTVVPSHFYTNWTQAKQGKVILKLLDQQQVFALSLPSFTTLNLLDYQLFFIYLEPCRSLGVWTLARIAWYRQDSDSRIIPDLRIILVILGNCISFALIKAWNRFPLYKIMLRIQSHKKELLKSLVLQVLPSFITIFSS